MSLIPVLLDWPLVLLPVHIVFLELIIDPSCSVIFEAEREETDVMNRPPRDPGERLFGMRTILLSVLQGAIVLLVALAVFGGAMYSGRGEAEARALSFTTLIAANLGLILTNRSRSRTILEILRSPNSAQWWVLGGATIFMGLVLTVPFLRDLFRFDRLHPDDVLFCLAAGATSVLWFEGVKLFRTCKMRRINGK